MNEFMTTEQLAERWKIHRRTLSRWRTKGVGPKYIQIGHRALYPMAEIFKVKSKTLL